MPTYNKNDIAAVIDHTILKAEARAEDVTRLCKEALLHGFAAVCVNPFYVKQVAEELKNSNIKTCSVVGFPLGANTSAMKAQETQEAVKQGAQEIDMVINIGAVKAGLNNLVEEDIQAVVQASGNAIVKVIIETCYLTQEQKILACQLSLSAGADFVKTSTGFGTGGALVEDVALMRKTVGDKAQVKASGGIRTFQDIVSMLEAGADRIGASSGVAIMTEMEKF